MIVLTGEKVECYECEGDECNDEESLYACDDAVACWKSSARGENGAVVNTRGCFSNPDHVQFMCNRRRRQHSSKNPLDDRFLMECCTENYCNGGAFPLLPNPSTSNDANQQLNSLMLSFAILAPILILGLIVFFVITCCRRCTKSRSSSNEHSVEFAAEVEFNSSHDSENSAFFVFTKTGKNSLRKVFSKVRRFFNRFSKTQKYNVADFNENHDINEDSFKEIIL